MKIKMISLTFVLFIMISPVQAQIDTIFIYGPGGPYPPINELAQMFSGKNEVKIVITKGPAEKWINNAKSGADIIYSGSEFMMTNFLYQLADVVNSDEVEPMYLRKSGLLVRPGNPLKISKLEDIIDSDVKILVINGSGLTGVWEDILGQTRDIDKLKKMRKNIKYYAKNSAEAKKIWIENPDVDVWVTWNIWQKSNAQLADFVELDNKYTIYRDFGVVLTKKGKESDNPLAFIKYLQSNEAKPVFEKWGWSVN